MLIKTYTELRRLQTFDERYEYLKLKGSVGRETFGFDRYINQIFYKSPEWKAVRDFVIIRDNGCDLGLDGYEIQGKMLIHHMNPISQDDIEARSDLLLNPEYLIVTAFLTHNAIHYGNDNSIIREPVVRHKNDTCPWKQTFNNKSKK